MVDSSREQLAARQAQLIRSLVGAEPAPQDFDAARIRAAGDALIQKRMRAVARVWPALSNHLGDGFSREFLQFANSHALPAGGAKEDGLAFARELIRQGMLPIKLRWRIFLRRWPFSLMVLLGILLPSFIGGCAPKADPTALHPELAVVKITTLSSDPGHSFVGSGFFVNSEGLIVTSLQNLRAGGDVVVTPSGGRPVRAELVQEDRDTELVLIKIPGDAKRPFLKLHQGDILPAMHVRVVGSEGITHGLFDHWENFGKEMAFTARIGLADSGAPLLGDDGKVVGIARGMTADHPAVNSAIPIWHVLRMMPSLSKVQTPAPQ